MAIKLGEMLLKAGLITDDQLKESLTAQKQSGEKLGFVLVSLGHVKEDDITHLLSDQYGVPSINLRHFEIDESVINLIQSEVAAERSEERAPICEVVTAAGRNGPEGNRAQRCNAERDGAQRDGSQRSGSQRNVVEGQHVTNG